MKLLPSTLIIPKALIKTNMYQDVFQIFFKLASTYGKDRTGSPFHLLDFLALFNL